MHTRSAISSVRAMVLVVLATLALAVSPASAQSDPSNLYGRWDWISYASVQPGAEPSVSVLSGTLDMNDDGTFQELFRNGTFLNSGAGTFTADDQQLSFVFDPSYGLDPVTYSYQIGSVTSGDTDYEGLSLRQDYADGSSSLYLLFRD